MEINKRKTSLHRVFSCLLILALLWGALPALAEVTHGVVTGDRVLFRKATTGSDYWDRLDLGWVAKVLDEFKSGGYTWYKVETNTPKFKDRTYTGYIRGDFFRMLTQAEESAWLVNKPQPDPSLGGVKTDPPEKTGAPESATPTPTPAAETAPPLEGDYGLVSVSGANLRQEPGGVSISALQKNQLVKVLAFPSTGNPWYHVSVGGLNGYLQTDHLRVLSPAELAAYQKTEQPGSKETPGSSLPQNEKASGTLTITKTSTNLRQEPGGKSLFQYPVGEVLNYYGAPVFSGGYYWARVIDSARSLSGYVRSDCYSLDGGSQITDPPGPTDTDSAASVRITLGGTNLREYPGGAVVAVLSRGRILPFYGNPTAYGGYNWVYVYDDVSRRYGYVRSDCYEYASDAPVPTPTPTPTPTSNGAAGVRITLGGTNLREYPGGTPVAVLSRGRVLPFYGNPTAYSGYNWVYVYDDVSRRYGYVRSDCYEYASDAPVPTRTPGPEVPSMGSLTLIKGGVNLRNAPGGRTVAQLDRGLVLNYTNFVQQGGYTWYLVNSPKGTGYVRSDVVQLDSGGETPPPGPDVTPPPSMLGYIVTFKSEINLREKPQAGSAVIGRVDKGLVLPLQGPVQTSNGYNWFQVLVDGTAGFLRGDCVRQMSITEVADYLNHGKIPSLTPPSPNDPPPATGYVLTTMTSVNVRATASLDARALGQVADAGTAFPLLGTLTAGGRLWYKISYQGQEGYVLGSLVRMMTHEEYLAYIASQPTPTPTPTPTATPPLEKMSKTAITTMDKVIVRSGAGSGNSNLLLIYKKGTVVSLLGQSSAVGTETWYSVRASGVNGWIRGDLLRILTPEEEKALINTGDPDSPSTASYRTLQLGSTGEDVLRLNKELNRLGYLQSAYVNSTYSSQTAEAVRAYQRAKGLTVDGIAGNNTQHKLYGTVPEDTYEPGGSGTVNPTLYPVELVDWYKGDINSFWGRGETAIMTDVRTNISLRIRRWAGGYHVDGEPLTSADTAALTRIYGVKTAQDILEKDLYQRRPVWITLKGRSFAASLYGVPHNYPDGDTIPDNNFNGQLCIHFYNSRVHVSGKVDKDHMNAIQYAYDHAPSRK